MAADYGQLTENLRHFYNFANKVVLFVGAGGRQLLDPTLKTKKLIAIDQDVEALRELRKNIVARDLQDSVYVLVTLPSDVVYFEFCLHEMVDPQKALTHARTLALDMVEFRQLPHVPGNQMIGQLADGMIPGAIFPAGLFRVSPSSAV